MNRTQQFIAAEWHYVSQEKSEVGPVSIGALLQLWIDQEIGDGTFVWCASMPAWKPIDEVKILKTLKKGLESNWYYSNCNTTERQSRGPVPGTEMIEKLNSGELTGNCLCWTEGFENWKPIRKTGRLWFLRNGDQDGLALDKSQFSFETGSQSTTPRSSYEQGSPSSRKSSRINTSQALQLNLGTVGETEVYEEEKIQDTDQASRKESQESSGAISSQPATKEKRIKDTNLPFPKETRSRKSSWTRSSLMSTDFLVTEHSYGKACNGEDCHHCKMGQELTTEFDEPNREATCFSSLNSIWTLLTRLIQGNYGYRVFSTEEWRPFIIREQKYESKDTKLIRCDLRNSSHATALPICSSILIRIPTQGGYVERPYTPISSSTTQGYFDLLIKRYPEGHASKYLHGLRTGQHIYVKGPFHQIRYRPNMKSKIGMIAGGTGITPMYQIINAIHQNPEDLTEIFLIYANLHTDYIMLKDELDKIADLNNHINVYYVVDRANDSWNAGTGYVTLGMLKHFLPSPKEDIKVLVCGPKALVNLVSGPKDSNGSQGELTGLLQRAGFSAKQVYKF